MPRFAKDTEVSVEKSRAEIESMLIRYKASEFTSGWKEGAAMVNFRLKDLVVRFVLPIPGKNEKRFKKKMIRGWERTVSDAQAERAWDQEVRQRWRALCLVIKAKLEAVECEISTLEKEFLAFIVMPGDITVGDWMIEQALPSIRSGIYPLALGPRRQPAEQIDDAEIVA